VAAFELAVEPDDKTDHRNSRMAVAISKALKQRAGPSELWVPAWRSDYLGSGLLLNTSGQPPTLSGMAESAFRRLRFHCDGICEASQVQS